MCMCTGMRELLVSLQARVSEPPGVGGIGTSESLMEMLGTELRAARAVSALHHLLSSQSLLVAGCFLRKALSLAWGCQFG